MDRIAQEWHLAHKMPKNPTLEQRIEWHIEHARHCSCRKMPESIAKAIAERKKTKKKSA